MARAHSGYHWSQQMPTPSLPKRVSHTLEAGVAGPEVELLLVAGTVGDVALPVDAEHRAVRVHQGEAVVVGLAIALEERDRDHHAQLLGHRCESRDGGMACGGLGPVEERILLFAAEVGPLEQLGGQDHLGAPGRGLAHQVLHLGRRSRQGCAVKAHWVAATSGLGSQNLRLLLGDAVEGTAPAEDGTGGRPRTRRPGKSGVRAATAASS